MFLPYLILPEENLTTTPKSHCSYSRHDETLCPRKEIAKLLYQMPLVIIHHPIFLHSYEVMGLSHICAKTINAQPPSQLERDVTEMWTTECTDEGCIASGEALERSLLGGRGAGKRQYFILILLCPKPNLLLE